MQTSTRTLCAAVAVLGLGWMFAAATEEKVPLDKLPKKVVDAVKAKFPGAELQSAEKEVEDGKTLYEVALKYKEQQYDVSVTPEGEIVEIEKAITEKDLPASVRKSLDQKYPKATIKKAEEITKGKEVTFEVLLVTADKKKIEVVLDGDGKVLEEEDGDDDE